MKHHRYNGKIDEPARKAIVDDITTLAAKMEPLVSIAPSDKRRLAKMGLKTRAFVTDAILIADKYPDILPQAQDPQSLRAKLNTVDNLREVHQLLMSLADKLRDTMTVAGAEVYEDARLVYTIAKTNVKTTGLQSAKESLKRRFDRKSRNPEVENVTTNDTLGIGN